MRFGVTGCKTIIVRVDPRITALYPPTLALTARSRSPFHLDVTLVITEKVLAYTKGLSIKVQGWYIDAVRTHSDI